MLVVAAIAEDVIVEELAAAVPSEGLAAEEEAGACVEAGSGSDVLFGVASRSGTLASWLQSLLSSGGGSTSAVDKDGAAAASQESPLTTSKSDKDSTLSPSVTCCPVMSQGKNSVMYLI